MSRGLLLAHLQTLAFGPIRGIDATMSDDEPVRGTVVCAHHGSREATFVCSHILDADKSGIPCGFNWHIDEDGNFQAFCDACIAMDEAAWEDTGSDTIRVLCIDCYRRAAALHGVVVSRPN